MNPRPITSFRIASILGVLGQLPLSLPAAHAESDIGIVAKSSLIEKVAQDVLSQLTTGKTLYQKTFPDQKFEMKNIKTNGIADLALTLGTGALGIEMPKDLKLNLAILKPSISVQPKVSNIEFHQISAHQLDMDFNVTLSKLSVRAPKIEIREKTILRNAATSSVGPEGNSCNPDLKQNRFYKNGIYADVINVSLIPVQPDNASDLTFKIRTRIKTSTAPQERQIQVLSIENNIKKALSDQYRLSLEKAVFPDIRLEINGKCYPLDHDKLNSMLQSDLETLKDQIVSASVQLLVKKGIEAANASLKQLKFKPEYTVNLPKAPQGSAQKDASVIDQVLKQLENLQYSVGLHHIEERSRSELGIIFSDQISAQPNELSLSDPILTLDRDYDRYVGRDTSDLVLAISKSSLENKLNLVKSLKVLEKSVLTKGISIDDQGFKVHRIDNDKLALTAFLKIDLNEMEGFGSWFGSKWEKLFGSTDGIVHLPIQINLTYSFGPQDSRGGRLLRFHIWIHNDFSKTQFGEHSNLDQTTSLVRNKILDKISEFQAQLTQQKMEIRSEEIEKRIGFTPYWIKVTEDGDLTLGLGFKSIRQFLPHLTSKR